MKFRPRLAVIVPVVYLTACGGSNSNLLGGGSSDASQQPASSDSGVASHPDSSTPPPGHDAGTSSGGKDASSGGIDASSGSVDASNPPPGVDAAQPIGSTGVTIYVEPSNGADENLIINAINGAKTSVHLEMYMLSASSFGSKIEAALSSRAKAGVDVKVILNETFPSGSSDSNSTAESTLSGDGVSVVWASSAFTYTHEKCMIIDATTAWIMTANMTEASYTTNREYLAVDTAPADVAEAEAIFASDFAKGTGYNSSPGVTPTFSGPLIVSPDPPMNSMSALVSFIESAHSSVYAEVEEIDNSSIANAFVTAAKNGATVDLVVANTTDNTGSNSAISTIKSGGGHVYVGGATESSSTATNLYIHAKAVVVDGTSAWVGSENFSTGSLESNREVGIIFTTASEVAKVETTIKADVSSGKAL